MLTESHHPDVERVGGLDPDSGHRHVLGRLILVPLIGEGTHGLNVQDTEGDRTFAAMGLGPREDR